MDAKLDAPAGLARPEDTTLFAILLAISFSHLLNDIIQSLVPAIYPVLKTSFALDFGQIGLITLAFQLTASLLQPFIGLFTDKRPSPYSLAIGMGFSLGGLLLLSVAPNFVSLLLAAALVGIGSSVFHPEASRVAHMASGGQRTAWRNPCFRSAARQAPPRGRCSQLSSSCRTASTVLHGFQRRACRHGRAHWHRPMVRPHNIRRAGKTAARQNPA